VSIELTDSLKSLLKETATQLKGAAKRRFQAQTVISLGHGGQLIAQNELGWDRKTIRKGIKELTTGITCIDNYSAKGRWKVEEHLPNLLEDLKKLVDSQSQTDPSFKSQRLYTRLTASEVRKLYQDNGGENNSRRTQFMKRIVEFAQSHHLNIRLAYYPPYHSKYNPIERTWAMLENHWNGSILDEIETALNFAKTMTWKGKHPVVKLVTQTYETGVKLTNEAMSDLEKQIERLTNSTHEKFSNLGKWFVDICCGST
jgi:Rhodopirellula transposase DDE domain